MEFVCSSANVCLCFARSSAPAIAKQKIPLACPPRAAKWSAIFRVTELSRVAVPLGIKTVWPAGEISQQSPSDTFCHDEAGLPRLLMMAHDHTLGDIVIFARYGTCQLPKN